MNASDRRRYALLLPKLCGKCRPSAASLLGKQLKKRFKKPIQREREAKEKKERLGRKGETAAIREACYAFAPHIEHAKLSPDRRLPAVPLGPAVDPGVSSQTKEREC